MTKQSGEPGVGGETSLGAYLVDGRGGARILPWAEVGTVAVGDGFLWLHLDRTRPEHQRWLREESGLPALTVRALLEEETRPRLVCGPEDILAILRGVNLNPEPDEDAMVSLRILCQPKRVISLRRVRLYSVMDLRDALLAGQGPQRPGAMLTEISRLLVDRQAGVIAELADEVDEIEERILDSDGRELRSRIAAFRRQAIALRRYLAPQREVMSRLMQERTPILFDEDRAQAREVAEAQTRLIEELDASRDRAAVAQEELAGRLADQMNRNMYILSIIAGIFLPLGFLTGLLGINVGGMPGVENDQAFMIVCALLLILAAFALWLFKKMRII